MSENSAEVTVLSNICIRCRKKVTTGTVCKKCGTLSHNCCLKDKKNVRFFKDGTVICCGDTEEKKSDSSAEPEIQLEEQLGAAFVDKLTIKYLEDLIQQKDLTIKNQEIAITSLREQLELMKQMVPNLNSTLRPSTSSKLLTTEKGKLYNDVAGSNTQVPTQQIAKNIVTSAIHNAKAEQVCHEIVNLTNDKRPFRNENGTRSRNILVGNNENLENCPFKAARSSAENKRNDNNIKSYHVTNLEPNVDDKELLKYLQNIAPHVRLEKLNSRYPQSYASFKVSVPADESDCILKSDIWPSYVVLNHFFRSRKHPSYDERRKINSD